MKKIAKIAVSLAACALVFMAAAKPAKADTVLPGRPSVATTLQAVDFGYDPGKIILPYGAMLSQDGKGNWVLAFLDTSYAVLNSRTGTVPLANGFTVAMTGEGIVYSKNINGVPIKVTYNLANCVARVDAANQVVLYRNGSLLSSIITYNGPTYTIESYNDSGTILKNETRNTQTNALICMDDYIRTPGMIIRTFYDALGNPAAVLPYYGDTKPAYY